METKTGRRKSVSVNLRATTWNAQVAERDTVLDRKGTLCLDDFVQAVVGRVLELDGRVRNDGAICVRMSACMMWMGRGRTYRHLHLCTERQSASTGCGSTVDGLPELALSSERGRERNRVVEGELNGSDELLMRYSSMDIVFTRKASWASSPHWPPLKLYPNGEQPYGRIQNRLVRLTGSLECRRGHRTIRSTVTRDEHG